MPHTDEEIAKIASVPNAWFACDRPNEDVKAGITAFGESCPDCLLRFITLAETQGSGIFMKLNPSDSKTYSVDQLYAKLREINASNN